MTVLPPRTRRSSDQVEILKQSSGQCRNYGQLRKGQRLSSLDTVKRSRPDFWCGRGVKHENLMGQDRLYM